MHHIFSYHHDMTIPFSEISVLLQRLEDIQTRDPPFLVAAEKAARIKEVTESWFKSHRRAINDLNADSAVAFLSILLPERRTDRVYGIQSPSLCRILSRCLSLSAARSKDLQAYKQPGRGDLAVCVERVLSSGGPPARPPVDTIEIEELQQVLAGNCRFSDIHKTKLPPGSSEARDSIVGNIFKRLQPNEAKWLVRLILKDFSPVRMNEALVLRLYHFLLPDLLRFQDSFSAAICLLKGELQGYPERPDPRSERLHRKQAAETLKPIVGVKVGRPTFAKGRSIESCLRMPGDQRCVLERKYDGEYCEVHIDMSRSRKPSECITIFSKSGKDSTDDRKGIHQTLVDCLHLGTAESKIRRKAVLLGEMVVYSNKEHRILPFEEIRKHVLRSGVCLGADEDSQPKPHEHLAIVFFDLLLLDEEVVMTKPVEERRTWLREVYAKIGGRAMGAEWKIVDFKEADYAKKMLVQQFAASIAERCEGLVLKPCGAPYFDLDPSPDTRTRRYIKLKKDYIADMGDEADFVVVGASYNAQQALKSGVPNIKWTEFHLGCLMNKADALRFDARPRFIVVGTIQQEACIPNPVLQAANAIGQFCAKPYDRNQPPANFDFDSNAALKMDIIFDTPFVFEVLGSGFEKPSNCSFFMLRHARVKKLHEDRTWKDCISMQELQEQAAATRAAPVDSESQETRRIIQKLEAKCKKKSERLRMGTPRSGTTVTPSTASTALSRVSNRTLRSGQVSDAGGRSIPSTTAGTDRTDDALDGTTLVAEEASSGAKRARQEEVRETPCPAAKRQRTATSDKAAQSARRAPPLSDITNSAPQPTMDISKPPAKGTKPSRTILQTLSTLFQPSAHESPRPTETPCSNPSCFFSSSNTPAAVYLAPPMPPVISERIHTLLAHHPSVTLIHELSHWDRLSFTHPPLTSTVSESQAYAGKRKIVLVDTDDPERVRDLVNKLLRLGEGKWRERVEIWDWKVLEGCPDYGLDSKYLGAGGGSWQRRRWFLGATMFDEGREKAMFVSEVGWLDLGFY